MPRNMSHATLVARTLVFASAMLVAGGLRAAGTHETREFADVVAMTQALVETHGAESVLLVCDIDNTLLAMDRELGSDQWFEWQEYLLDNEPDSPDLVAKDFKQLLAAQGVLFHLGKMHPPEEDLPEHIKTLQQAGVSTLVLTSRGHQFREYTMRELAANGYDFPSTALPITDPPCGVYFPYDLDNIGASGLTSDEAKRFGLREPRGITYRAGVMMTAGQHKGAMLLTLLARCPKAFKAVVFVDDHGRHVTRVYDALSGRGIDATVFHYKKEDTNVNRFRYGDKRGVARAWKKLDKTLEAVFE